MPYEICRKGNRYQVVNTDTGKVHSTTTHAKAEKQLKLLKSIEKDWTPAGDGTFTRNINGKPATIHIK
jgi:hypothetical protein